MSLLGTQIDMKYFNWSEEKNQALKKSRNISFEEIVLAINDGNLLDILHHHDKKQYPNQFLLIVEIHNYAYVVPYVEDGESYFLKTIYPGYFIKKFFTQQGKGKMVAETYLSTLSKPF